ncbi:MAG: single-stranded DNA-binding protein, partial [Alicyclobacillus sp.]|nr:single-stranded DNA-binding protein [Alicyclobacillus sp.]
ELCAQYLHKGRLAAVDGRLQIRTYENREGQKVRVAEVVAESVRFLDRSDNPAPVGAGPGPSARPAPEPRRAPNRYEDDPFADDSQTIHISDDDLPF